MARITLKQVEVRENVAGEWDWQVVASNGEDVGGSHQGFRDPTDALRGFVDFVTLLGLSETKRKTIRIVEVRHPSPRPVDATP